MKFYVHGGMAFWYCPGCKYGHSVPIDGSGGSGKNWQWNGSVSSPTLTPSVRHFVPATWHLEHGERKEVPEYTSCHYFITDGFINLLDDSRAHDVRGVHALPDFPEGYRLPGMTPVQ